VLLEALVLLLQVLCAQTELLQRLQFFVLQRLLLLQQLQLLYQQRWLLLLSHSALHCLELLLQLFDLSDKDPH
jgi:hypothetical protein